MRRLTLLFALFFTAVAAAQPSFVGELFPLTQTRYGAAETRSVRIVAAGGDIYLFWVGAGSNIRMTRLVPGERRAGRPVVPDAWGGFDVIWTGQHFLIAGTNELGVVVDRVSLDGERIGERVLAGAGGVDPRLAWNGTTALVLYSVANGGNHLLYSTVGDRGVIRSAQDLMPAPLAATVASRDVASNGDGFAVVASRQPDGDLLFIIDRNGMLRSSQSFAADFRHGEIAHDGGQGYVWARNIDDRTVLTRVDAFGRIGETVAPDGLGRFLAIGRTADGFAVAVRHGESVHVARFDTALERDVARESAPLDLRLTWSHPLSGELAASGERLVVAWLANGHGYAAELPFDGSRPRVVTFGAASQRLVATAAGEDATLFVWIETVDGVSSLRGGTRLADGTWSEPFLLPNVSGFPVAASNGSEFLLGYYGRDGFRLQRLDRRSEPIGQPFRAIVPFSVISILWNGERYVLFGGEYWPFPAPTGYTSIMAATMSVDGTISAPVTIRGGGNSFDPVHEPRLAWNGRTYLVTWVTLPQPNSLHSAIAGVRLGADLRWLDATDRQLAHGALSDAPELIWDGSDFVVVVPDRWEISVVRVTAPGDRFQATAIPGSAAAKGVTVARVAGGVAVAWLDDRMERHHVATVRQGTGSIVATHALAAGDGSPLDLMPQVVALPGGKATFATSRVVDAAPHHGAPRVMAAVLDLAPLSPITSAPRVSVRREGTGKLVIDWTAVPERVTGYRVEYRIGDGNWLELDRPPDPTVRTATFTVTRPDATHAFRVRAANDAGMGPYSAPATSSLPRRRAVR